MRRPGVSSIANAISEQFTDVWKLLAETGAFLGRTRLFAQYEAQLREMRATLQSAPKNGEVAAAVKKDLVELRKGLRHLGYDLSLGSQNLVFDGFRNDACLRDGFRRLVLFLGDEGVYWLAGEDNHVAICGYLEDRLEKMRIRQIRERHFLWYRRLRHDLILSGSDTETKEDFVRLERIGNANPLLLLSALKGLK